jgi:hypothetical protein
MSITVSISSCINQLAAEGVAETMLNECVMNTALEPKLREYAWTILSGGRV